ncbi:hypothetical protein NA56DRAFT_705565 [Hyaloscypha hepaticicola]|uniref:Uncharacterized protein n=1 Tax=Hyaloscypha hepaticicola TaxID=2082293 RepID=A0A2J6PZC4_9HELO|nr:hypothetical protein NA56DRAFT_705565 [Hyaloscypha hepaticicola]
MLWTSRQELGIIELGIIELGIIELEAPEWKPHDPQSKPPTVEAHQITSAYLGYLTQQVETGPKTGSQKPNSGPNGALYQASWFIDDLLNGILWLLLGIFITC